LEKKEELALVQEREVIYLNHIVYNTHSEEPNYIVFSPCNRLINKGAHIEENEKNKKEFDNVVKICFIGKLHF